MHRRRPPEGTRPRTVPLLTVPLLAVLLLAPPAAAQRGDKAGEPQPDPPADLVVPAAPVLSPEQALKSLVVAEGYRVELVASEPLIHDPICLAFGADGRVWVVEMRTFMPDVDGTGERDPASRIVVLEDTDRDGRMDRSQVFLDGLVLPRGIALCGGGVLVIEPPHLWFCRDTDGDGRGDARVRVASGFDAGLRNLEHAGNGLMRGLDNWIYVANYGRRFRWSPDGFRTGKSFLGGQWGLCQDDWGRRYYNYNSDQLRADLYPSHYAVRNPHLGIARGVNHRVAADQRVWPVRVTPGVNRGYRKGLLRDGKLTRFTAVCGPAVYRGELAAELAGNAFVCEPSGLLVRRNVVTEKGGVLRGENAYRNSEFLASTDERFRPVNAYSAPDGALWIVDMYRGIIQHGNFVTTFLRKQILARGLDKPIGLGRIYRVLPADAPTRPLPNLTGLDTEELVKRLRHPNGPVRDAAQQLLVERGDRDAVPALRAVARRGADPRFRVQALWTLEGLGALLRDEVVNALFDDDPRVRATGVRLVEAAWPEGGDTLLWSRAAELVDDPEPIVRWQLALTAAELNHADSAALLAELVSRAPGDANLRGAVLSGLAGRELAHLQLLLARDDWREQSRGRFEHLRAVARCVVAERDPTRVSELLVLIAVRADGWVRVALLEGAVMALPGGGKRARVLAVAAEPVGLRERVRRDEGKVLALEKKLLAALRWPGLAGVSESGPKKLTEAQGARIAQGKVIYGALCAACHQQNGTGLAGLAPTLRDTDWVLGPERRLVRIVLHGLSGPVEVGGEKFDILMPGLPQLTDEQVAAVLTYVRRAWGHDGAPVEPSTVSAVRSKTEGRVQPWTAAELRKTR